MKNTASKLASYTRGETRSTLDRDLLAARMHELSIALSLIDLAAEEAERQGGGRVVAVHLKLGVLSGVIPDALHSAWEQACQGSPMVGCRLVIEQVPITIHCPHCGVERPARSVQEISCVECGTPASRILTGREMELAALEILDEQPPQT